MNSEELELSLRSEFEDYLKTVVAAMRQETTEFQSKIDAEFERHKSEFAEALRAFSTRFESEHQFDAAFTGSVAEHLRLARDEGARITANAMVEAEKLDQSAPSEAAPVAAFDGLRDAINDISSKNSQSAILKSLVQHAAGFAPRGAFFIIKNDHFVGWKVFGTDVEDAEAAVREIHFPTSADSLLGAAVQSLSTVEGSVGGHPKDSTFLSPLNFGQPDRMYAIPLVARGRGVAVLYADYGGDSDGLNLEALEMLVRVAGLTVELHANAQPAKSDSQSAASDLEAVPHDSGADVSTGAVQEFDDSSSEMVFEAPAAHEPEPSTSPFSENVSFEDRFPQEVESPKPFDAEPIAESPFAEVVVEETAGYVEPVFETVETEPEVERFIEPEPETETVDSALVFDSGGSIEDAGFTASPFEKSIAEFEPAAVTAGGFKPAVEAPAPAIPQARLSDRPVDLPIEVPEEERRSHNDARRFARLLVSEIKLYNEKKVIEGREASDLYDRLREAIDRSREMYDKRVQPPVAAKFDYFHYELVNSLAEGDAGRLGGGYPGAGI